MPALPSELIRQIVEDIVDDVNDPVYFRHLSVVSLTSRLLRHEAQRLLFRDSGELYTASASRGKTILFLDAVLSSSERLALFVNRFSITFDDFFNPTSDETTALIRQLGNALEAMRNLTFLDVVQRTAGLHSLPSILQDTHFKLTSFRWSGYSNGVAEVIDLKTDFLRRQDNIDHLQMLGFVDQSTLKSISADILPRLRSLSAPYPLTEILLPGRDITSLQWSTPLDNPATPYQSSLVLGFPFHPGTLSKELGRIRYLSYDPIDTTVPVGPDIRRIAPHLTRLICLETCRDIIKHVEALSQIPHLEILVLNADGSRSRMPKRRDMTKVATACESLEHIDIEDNHGKLLRFYYDYSSKTHLFDTIDESQWYAWINDHDNPWINDYDSSDEE
ncbi:hypothetical protein D9619_009532 [Psilocybe cf. subviscida]|uniref:Uncharacterized protein n=1 Tax=Psilocybe cf. subviscida TaxID=2480587 RepID=A0A8H5F6I8_9AGAR|nr:hypothetical protein D9619_009532 [Psilocybe cf. subviscida]